MSNITKLEIIDLRFPTSREKDGSDAMNPDPDYSAAYVVVHTDAADSLEDTASPSLSVRATRSCARRSRRSNRW
ncbi:hypothetical protein GCM10020255_078150 [Rhodococcus baikonurensis]